MSPLRSQDNVEEGYTADTSMISQNSPYQSTTQPIPDRRQVACLTLDLAYIKSKIGILNLVILGLSLLTLICAGIARHGHGFIIAVALWSFIYATILIFVFAFRFFEKIPFINWERTSLLNDAILTILFAVGGCISAAKGAKYGNGAGVVTSIFGFITCAVFGLKTYLEFLVFKKKRDARQQSPTVAHVKGAEL